MAAATPVDWPRPNPPLEHQFLPPSLSHPASWGDDAARLQQLMLGSPRLPPAPSSSRPGSSAVRDLGGLFDFDSHKPLPSGWERCLDLKSGEVYLVKSDSNVNGAPERQNRSHSTPTLLLDLNPRTESVKASKSFVEKDRREDWALRWLHEKTEAPSERTISTGKSFKRQEVVNLTGEGEGQESKSQPEREALCLDLDLKLTSKHLPVVQPEARQSCADSDIKEMVKTSGKRNFVDRSQPESLVPATKLLSCTASTRVSVREENNMVQPQQQWRWRGGENSNPEVVRESTMATAVCSSCLMYVVLRKTNPTCPRCGNPIILDCSSRRSSKRHRLELTPDDLSLSNDFSR